MLYLFRIHEKRDDELPKKSSGWSFPKSLPGRGLRALIVLDDVWIAQHLEPFAPVRGRATEVVKPQKGNLRVREFT